MNKKLKVFNGNHMYRGRAFDFQFCAANKKEAAEILGISVYQVQKYVSAIPVKEPFEGVRVTPYGSESIMVIGSREEMTLENFKKIVDKYCEYKTREWK